MESPSNKRKRMLRSSMSMVATVAVVSFLFVLPDILFSLTNELFRLTTDFIRASIFIAALSIGLTIGKSRIFTALILTILGLLQFIQFCSIKYFGTQISSFSIYLMTKEIKEVLHEANYYFWSYAYIFPIIAIPFFAIYRICRTPKKFKSTFGSVIVIITLLSLGIKPWQKPTHLVPDESRITLSNSVKVFLGYLVVLCKGYNIKDYKPYIVEKLKSINEPITIVYIIGESCNASHMSLFGYGRETTPLLSNMAKSNNFYHTNGVAGSICTIASYKFMCNAIREANNPKQTGLDTTNLFRLAKESGFKTFYISAQDLALTKNRYKQYVDVMRTRKDSEDDERQCKLEGDKFLIKLLQNQSFAEKNFVMIHQHFVHCPYEEIHVDECRKCFKGTDIVDKYDNAMLCNDYIISTIFNMFSKFKGKIYIFFASDHNELFGEGGLFGHGQKLHQMVAQIPVIAWSNDQKFLKSFKKIFAVTHYDISETIIRLLGFSLTNPNEEESVYYISGVDYNGRYGYIKFKKDYKNKKIEYSDIMYD